MTIEEHIQELEENVILLLSEIKKSKRRLVDEEDAAIYLGSRPSTLRIMRSKGKGPLYTKVDGLGVKYDIKDLEEYCNKLPKKGGGII